jgi:malonyl CoA-acyl carrier protein transacylase
VGELLSSGTEALGLISPEWRPFLVLLFVGIGWRVAVRRGWVNGGSGGITEDEIQDLLAPLKKDLEEDVVATRELAGEVRDVVEQLNRNVNTAVVVLGKVDALRDILVALDAKIGMRT